MKKQYKIEREASGLRYNVWVKSGRSMWRWAAGTYSLALAQKLVERDKLEDAASERYLRHGEVR